MEGSAIKDFVMKHTLPLVGHRKPSNDAKRYTRRPLVVVYYSVDFSFDYRAGKGPQGQVVGLGIPPGPLQVGGWVHLWHRVIFLLCYIATLSFLGGGELESSPDPC